MERPPLLDISNKLHAMVDEFVSNLTSKCDSLANNISSQAHVHAAVDNGPEVAKAPRPSNRTTTEVLNGLRRPHGDSSTDTHDREGKTHVQHATPNSNKCNTRSREGGRFVGHAREKKPRSSTVEGTDIQNDVTSVDIGSEETLSRDEPEHGRGTEHMAVIGKSLQTIEILSSDPSSDEGRRTKRKYSQKHLAFQTRTRNGNSQSWGRRTETYRKSPTRSPESSHLMNYSYEEDTSSLGGKSPGVESTFPKLKWPKDVATAQEEEIGKKSENNNVHGNNEFRKKNERKKLYEKTRVREGDESSEDDPSGNEKGADTDGEEPPVLPKVPVKRKLMTEPRVAERSTQRGRPKSGNPQTKKQRTPQIDAYVITQLEFGKRPQNCVSISMRYFCVSCTMASTYVMWIDILPGTR